MKKFVVFMLALCLSVAATACGGKQVGGGSGLKPTITINVYDGGNGTEWIEQMAAEFNNNTLETNKYEIVIDPEKTSTNNVIENINNNRVGNIDAYYVSETGYKQLIHADKLEDLTDILSMKVDGTNKTIGDKLGATATSGSKHEYYTSWKNYASKNGAGLYMLPYGDSYLGYIFDYDTFEENGWLFKAGNTEQVKNALDDQGILYEENLAGELIFKSYSGAGYVNYVDGDVIQSAGKDGKYGTYDDGQPVNIAEWQTMINRIKGTPKCVPFIWTSVYEGYTDNIVTAFIAQYSGYNAYQTLYSFDSNGEEITLNDGTKTVITPANGYKAYSVDGFKKAVEFLNTYMTGNANVHELTRTTDMSNKTAQVKFINGFFKDDSNPMSAILVEGAWWENEARAAFNALSNNNYKDRGYGKRDYRFMLIPAIEGQKGIDGNGNGSFMSVQSSGGIIIPKMKDAEKLGELKQFIAYTLSDENLRKFTRLTGVIQPFDYELTAEDRASMTPFARNNWDLYHDTENIKLIRPLADQNANPLKFALPSSAGFASLYLLPVKIEGKQSCAIDGLLDKGMTVDQVVQASGGYYSSDTWTNILNAAKTQGFFND